ncbi:MAG: hypothetical protein O7H41_09655 [Planctomycetota bacterium]|nr:hypothetical protein [Planctomycetota bacterium]
MDEKRPPALPGPALIAVVAIGGIVSLVITFAALHYSASHDSPQEAVPPTVIRPRTPPLDLPDPPPTISALDSGNILLADNDGHLFLIGRDPEEEPPRLVLRSVYRLVRDAERNLDKPSLKSPNGWYLDDLASEKFLRIRVIRQKFEKMVAAGGVTGDVAGALAALARDLAEEGEIPYLTEQLRDRSYLARRSAAIALGEEGWRRAVPILLEILSHGDEKAYPVVGPILADLTGIVAPAETNRQEMLVITKRWADWWAENGD